MFSKHLRLLGLVCVLLFVATEQTHAACAFNVAGNAAPDSLRDGVLLVRYAKGLRGPALVTGTGATAANVEASIANTIATNLPALDVNGNGVFDTDDAAVIARNVFGFGAGGLLPDGRAGPYATRTTAAKLKSFIDAGCTTPVVLPPTAEQFEASRFLMQSSFGPSRADVASLLTLGADTPSRASAWITAQTAMPRGTSHYQYLLTRKSEYDAAVKTFGSEMSRESFWGQALTSPDQLRQRLAFALSEILVVSDYGPSNDPFELAGYLDLLADNAFTNYRDILYKVALSPAMGRYLSHLKNDGGNSNPNENFAREVLQLFSVGLFMLDGSGNKILSDGSVGLPPAGQPIPTYTETTVKGFAKVFTGLSYDDPYCKTGDPGYSIAHTNCTDGYGDTHPSWNWAPDRSDLPPNPITLETFPPVLEGWRRPMVAFPGRHSALGKQLLLYTDPAPVEARCVAALLPANQTLAPIVTTGSGVNTRTKVNVAQANAVINTAIDNIFCHPNVGPFIAKQLIRFFVTSTPSAAYVASVASAFNNTGGVRGDMKAVIRAVLTHPEALQASATAPMNFGKLKEPMLRLSSIFRAFNSAAPSGRHQITYGLDDIDNGISQGPLQSPTVFNYFHPEFSPPGPIGNANATGPEFEITTTTAIASTQNYFSNLVSYSDGNNSNAFNTNLIGRYNCNTTVISSTDPTAASRQHCIFGDLVELYSLHADSNAMFDYLNLVLLGGSLSASNKAALVAALDNPGSAGPPVVAAAYPTTATPVLPVLPANPTPAQQTTFNTALTTYNNAVSTWQGRKRDRVKGALWLVVHSPEFQIQR